MAERRRHFLSDIDEERRTGVCACCGPVRLRSNGPANKQRWRCGNTHVKRAYTKLKKSSCERCGFEALDLAQLDVHHRDRDRRNNHPSNLETLCANCHRYEHRNGS